MDYSNKNRVLGKLAEQRTLQTVGIQKMLV